jgi:D-serine deaminase-like pyridoxal phosphate-dependent protein
VSGVRAGRYRAEIHEFGPHGRHLASVADAEVVAAADGGCDVAFDVVGTGTAVVSVTDPAVPLPADDESAPPSPWTLVVRRKGGAIVARAQNVRRGCAWSGGLAPGDYVVCLEGMGASREQPVTVATGARVDVEFRAR